MSNKDKWNRTESREKEGKEILIGWNGATGYLCDKNWNKLHSQKYHYFHIYKNRSSSGYTLSGEKGGDEKSLFTLEEYIAKKKSPNLD